VPACELDTCSYFDASSPRLLDHVAVEHDFFPIARAFGMA